MNLQTLKVGKGLKIKADGCLVFSTKVQQHQGSQNLHWKNISGSSGLFNCKEKTHFEDVILVRVHKISGEISQILHYKVLLEFAFVLFHVFYINKGALRLKCAVSRADATQNVCSQSFHSRAHCRIVVSCEISMKPYISHNHCAFFTFFYRKSVPQIFPLRSAHCVILAQCVGNFFPRVAGFLW